MTPSERTPTLCMTPPNVNKSSSIRASMSSTAAKSVTSATSTRTSTPLSRNSRITSSVARSGSRRPFRTIVPAPFSASQRATAQPIPPMPPVTRYVRSSRRLLLTRDGILNTFLPMCRASRIASIADRISERGQTVWGRGVNSPAERRAMTREREAPVRAGSSEFRASRSRMEYATSGRDVAISSSPQILRFEISTKRPPVPRQDRFASMNPSPVRLFSST